MKHLFKIYIISMLALVGLLLCSVTAGATLVETENGWVDDPSIDTSWFDSLEPKSEYALSTEAQLRGLVSLVNDEQYYWKPNRNESFKDVTFVLTRDITLTTDWTPIGVDEQITFEGTFDGKGHTISGLDVKRGDPYSGFFGYLSGKVRNLSIEGNVNSTADFCGGVAGFVSPEGRISHCTTNVQVNGRNEAGGLAGESRGKIWGCVNYGEVIGASMVGGVVGESRGGIVKKCGNRGLVYSNGAGSFNNGTGGVAGKSVSASTLTSCYNVGDVISSNEAVGGVTGYTNSSGSSIVDCYSIGSIRIEDPQVVTAGVMEPGSISGTKSTSKLPVYAGGIAGYVGSQTLVVRNCYNAGKITGADYAGGIIGKCMNDMFSGDPPAFANNYYGKGYSAGAIAADRNNNPMKVRGAATEIYDSAFGHLASSLGEAYMDDRAGDYGSQGRPVLIWQKPFQTENQLAVLKHIDPSVLMWLHNANLTLNTAGFRMGRIFLGIFDPPTVINVRVIPNKDGSKMKIDPGNGDALKVNSEYSDVLMEQTTPTKGPLE